MLGDEIKKNTVLLVGAKTNYLLISLKDRLSETSLKVNVFSADVDTINKIDQNAKAVILYADMAMIQDQQALVYLKDMILERDIPIFIIGSREELDEIKEIIPEHIIQEEFGTPVNVREIAEKIERFIASTVSVPKKKLLVVDDSSIMLHNLKGWLSDKYQVTLADSGIAAIKCISLNRPDLIILDYEMPICDGKQVLQMIRSEMEFADIPVIFLTGRGDRESVMEVMALKPAGYLLKSMRPIEIIQAINEFFEKQKGKLLEK